MQRPARPKVSFFYIKSNESKFRPRLFMRVKAAELRAPKYATNLGILLILKPP